MRGANDEQADVEVKAMEAALTALMPLKPEERRRALSWLWEKLEITGTSPINPSGLPSAVFAGTVPGAAAASASGTPKQFLGQKDPHTDVERMTCLAYYLTHYRGTAQFKTKELTDLNTEAAQPKFSNPADAATNAAKMKCLSLAGAGKKQITVHGEKLVEALPDREKVKALGLKSSSRRKKGKNKTSKP